MLLRTVAIAFLIILETITAKATDFSKIDMSPGLGFPNKKPLDIEGFYPGMPAPQALASVQKLGTLIQLQERSADGSQYVWLASAKRNGDRIIIVMSDPAAGGQVLSIRRDVEYAPNTMPSASKLINALTDKFGKPDKNEGSPGYKYQKWFFPNNNQPKDPAFTNLTDMEGALPGANQHKNEKTWIEEYYKDAHFGDELIEVLAAEGIKKEDRLYFFWQAIIDADRIRNVEQLVKEYNLRRSKDYESRPFG